LVGVGFGNFSESFTTYAITHASGPAVGGYFLAGRAAHNVLLGATVETGIVGGTLLFAFFATAVVSSLGERGNVVRVALIGLLVQSMFLDIIEQKQLWLFLALAFGLGATNRLRAAAADNTASGELNPGLAIPRPT
jgi:O-antigen ligase